MWRTHAGFATDGLAFFCLNCNRSFGSLTGLTKHLDVLGFNNPDIWLTIPTKSFDAAFLDAVKHATPHQDVVRQHGDDLGAASNDFVGSVFDVGLDERGVVEPGA